MGFMQLACVGSGLHLLRVQGFEEGSPAPTAVGAWSHEASEKATGFADAVTGQSGQLREGHCTANRETGFLSWTSVDCGQPQTQEESQRTT